MKKKMLLFWLTSMFVGLQSCGNAKMGHSMDLVVVEQTDTVYGHNESNQHEWASFTVDVPVNGPKVLLDSVMAFVNKKLYDACESNAHFNEDIIAFTQEEMYTDDGERLFSRYMEKYKPLMQDSLWRAFGLTMIMEAQTDKYVTYGLQYFYCGAGSSSQKSYCTFDKHDGHQVKEIINHENLVRFFEDYPESNTIEDDALAVESEWEFSSEYRFDNSCYGLLDDHFSLVIEGCGNHFLLTDFPYNQIFSYLSPEAQALVE